LSTFRSRGQPCVDDANSVSPVGVGHDDEAPCRSVTECQIPILPFGMIRIGTRQREGVVKVEEASRNPTPCFARFAESFCGSNSNSTLESLPRPANVQLPRGPHAQGQPTRNAVWAAGR
jgi:hypothetical protein